LTQIAFLDPSDEHLKLLKELHTQLNISIEFREYWTSYIHRMGKPVPKVTIEFAQDELDLKRPNNHWIFIDVWGTWCKPCIRELPEFQSFYLENKHRNNSTLKIYTFSFGSQNLQSFMEEHHYTFPVYEIDRKINELFEITAYPTKILISPGGNFIKIPSDADWKAYIQIYTQLFPKK
jgi:thiol-disulfide isomerase/thioredoxin